MSENTTYTSNIPEYAQAPFERAVKQAEALANQPYQPYQGERTAQFSPLQLQAFQAAQNQQVSPWLGQAAGITQQASLLGLNQQYNPSQFYAQQVQPGQIGAQQVNAGQFGFERVGGGPQVLADRIAAGQMGFERVGGGPQVQADRISGGQIGFERVGAGQVGTQGFTAPGAAEAYMSPYMQNVVNVQQREAQRQADIARTQRGAQAVGAGAFGGSRQAIMEAEAARNLAQQKGDIQSQGLQSAYQQAQSMFTSDQARALQAQQANQQAMMQAQQANQQAGLTTGQVGLQSYMQAQQANQQAAMQAALANQQEAQRAALANQQAGLTTGQTNLQTMMQAQQANQQYGMQAQLANQQEAQRAALANQQAGLTTGQAGLGAYMQAQQLNQQAGLTAGQANLQAQMQAQQQNQQAGLEAQRLSEQSRQYGAGFGQQGMQAALQGANQLGNLGQLGYGQQMGIMSQQAALGGAQQQQVQNMLNTDYNAFQQAQNYPYQQLGFLSDVLRGTAGTSRTMYETYTPPQPSTMQNLVGLGSAAYGISQMAGVGKAKGGSIKAAGLNELALSRMKG